MTIKFLTDYSVGTPPESFKAGQVLKNRDHASEAHFVRRRVAAYMAPDGALTDFDGQPVAVVATAPKRVKKPAGAEKAVKSKAKAAKPNAKADGGAQVPNTPGVRQVPSGVLGGRDVRGAASTGKA